MLIYPGSCLIKNADLDKLSSIVPVTSGAMIPYRNKAISVDFFAFICLVPPYTAAIVYEVQGLRKSGYVGRAV